MASITLWEAPTIAKRGWTSVFIILPGLAPMKDYVKQNQSVTLFRLSTNQRLNHVPLRQTVLLLQKKEMALLNTMFTLLLSIQWHSYWRKQKMHAGWGKRRLWSSTMNVKNVHLFCFGIDTGQREADDNFGLKWYLNFSNIICFLLHVLKGSHK